MTTINQLSTVSSLSSGDKLVIWSDANADSRKASISTLRDFLQQNFTVTLCTSLTASSFISVTGCKAASLPGATIAGQGARATVTDATQTLTAGIGATVSGGGANIVPVFSDGTNWKIG